MTADDARTFTAGGARHGDLSALLDRLEAAHERWDTDSAGLDVATTNGEVWNVLFRRPRWMSGAEVHELVAEHNALPTLVAELRAHQAAVQAVRELADDYDGAAASADEDRARSTDPDEREYLRRVAAAGHGTSARIRAAVAALDPKEQDHA